MPAHATVQSRSLGHETSGGHSAPRHLPPLPTEPAAPAPSATSHSVLTAADPATVGSGVTAQPNIGAMNGDGPVTGVSALLEGPGSRPD